MEDSVFYLLHRSPDKLSQTHYSQGPLFVTIRTHFGPLGQGEITWRCTVIFHLTWMKLPWEEVLTCERRERGWEPSASFPTTCGPSPSTPGPSFMNSSLSFMRSAGKVKSRIFFVSGEATLFYHIFPFSKFSGDACELGNDFNWKRLYLVSSCSCEWFYCRWIISSGCITQIKSSPSCPRKPASVQRLINKKH